jgi:hypothetical protein
MLRVIADLAGDWRQLDERIEGFPSRTIFLHAGIPAVRA